MAKISISEIEGYENMTAEEKISALENFEFPNNDDEIATLKADVERYKKATTKACGEAAEYKRQMRAKMSEDEIKAKEDAEKQEELQNNYNALLEKVKISENKAKYISLGYEESLAEETARALVSGDIDTVFANEKKHLTAFDKAVRADVLKATPRPDVSGKSTGGGITKEQFNKMTYAERMALYNENRELYKELSKK